VKRLVRRCGGRIGSQELLPAHSHDSTTSQGPQGPDRAWLFCQKRAAARTNGLSFGLSSCTLERAIYRLVRLTRALLLGTILLGSIQAHAVGTGAGVQVPNAVTIEYAQAGITRSANASATFWVDELLDVSVTSSDASSIGVLAGQASALQQYTLTNLGNGTEAFRLTVDAALAADGWGCCLCRWHQ